MIDLIDLGLKAINSLKNIEDLQIEVFLTDTNVLSISMEKGSIRSAQSSIDSGASIRVFWKKCTATAYTTALDEQNVLRSAKNALSAAKAGKPDPLFTSLPEPKSLSNVTGIFDQNIESLSAQDSTSKVIDAAKAAKIDDRIYSVNVFLAAGSQRLAVANSLGVACEEECTFFGVAANVVAKDKDDMSSGSESKVSRTFKDVNPNIVAEIAAKSAIRSLNAKRINTTMTMPIVLNPKAAATIIAGGLSVPLNADFVQRGRSYLCEKLGEEIGCDKLTVVDDGTLPGGLLSTRFDAEGTPSQRTMLVENGVLKNYIYDSYTAGIEKRESTGNCLRSGNNIGFGDYRVSPYISARNLVIAEGKGSEEDLISEVKEGILLCDTADMPNFSTGEFSGLMAEAYKIENGEIAYPIKQATIGISMLDFFKGIDAVGADRKQLVTSGVDGSPKSVTASTMRIKAARVAG